MNAQSVQSWLFVNQDPMSNRDKLNPCSLVNLYRRHDIGTVLLLEIVVAGVLGVELQSVGLAFGQLFQELQLQPLELFCFLGLI